MPSHANSVYSVAFSPDGATLASGSEDNTVKLWDVSTGEAVPTLTGHTAGVTSVAFSPDGATIASGSQDGTIRLWDVDAIFGPKEPPIARFIATPTRPSILVAVQFVDQSRGPDGRTVNWHWDFGDGNSSTARNPTHTYTRKGTFTVKLTVTDKDGLTASTAQLITMVNLPPVATFAYSQEVQPSDPRLVLLGREVTFDASQSHDPDGEIVRYVWDLGDGTTAEGRVVTHI